MRRAPPPLPRWFTRVPAAYAFRGGVSLNERVFVLERLFVENQYCRRSRIRTLRSWKTGIGSRAFRTHVAIVTECPLERAPPLLGHARRNSPLHCASLRPT